MDADCGESLESAEPQSLGRIDKGIDRRDRQVTMVSQGQSLGRRVLVAVAATVALVLVLGSNAAVAKGPGPERIVGGVPTTIAEWPWQTAIVSEGAGNGFQRQFCGGSLVAPNVVLTAGHCAHDIFDSDGDFDDPDLFSVITGRTTLSTAQGQEIEVSDIFVAVNSPSGPVYESAGDPTPSGPDLFDPSTLEWDAVFFELAANSTSTPIKIAGPTETALWAPGIAAFATGWGTTSSGGSSADTLREVEFHMISDSFCSSPTSYGTEFFPEVMVCAGEETGGKDTCQGDSGGPLVVADRQGCIPAGRRHELGLRMRAAEPPRASTGGSPMTRCARAIATGIQTEFGVNVLGYGGVPPDDRAPRSSTRLRSPGRRRHGLRGG